MANIKSSKKRIRVSKRNRLQNLYYKSSVRNLIKLFSNSILIYKSSQNIEDKIKAQKILNTVFQFLDKGLKRNVFHKNKVSRKKSRLTIQLKKV